MSHLKNEGNISPALYQFDNIQIKSSKQNRYHDKMRVNSLKGDDFVKTSKEIFLSCCFLILLLLCTDSQAAGNLNSPPHTDRWLDSNYPHVIILASPEKKHNDPYYYALLTLKEKKPSSQMKIDIINAQSSADLAGKYHIHAWPAMIVAQNNKAFVLMEGEKNWSDIYRRLSSISFQHHSTEKKWAAANSKSFSPTSSLVLKPNAKPPFLPISAAAGQSFIKSPFK